MEISADEEVLVIWSFLDVKGWMWMMLRVGSSSSHLLTLDNILRVSCGIIIYHKYSGICFIIHCWVIASIGCCCRFISLVKSSSQYTSEEDKLTIRFFVLRCVAKRDIGLGRKICTLPIARGCIIIKLFKLNRNAVMAAYTKRIGILY